MIKNIIIAIVALIILVAAYFVFFNKEEVAPLGTTTGALVPTAQVVGAGAEIGQEFIDLLLSLRNLKLDDSTFTSPVFNSLQDYTITLVPEGNEGRPNPFAPIGIDLFQAEEFGGVGLDFSEEEVGGFEPIEPTESTSSENGNESSGELGSDLNALLGQPAQ